MTMETKKDYINRIYREARMKGLCFSQAEFSRLLGMNQGTISNALKGNEKYLTDNFIKRVKAWEAQVLHKDEPATAPAPVQDQRPDIVIPAATMDLYTSMAKSIDRLTALVETLQSGASAFTTPGAFAPKNFRVDK